MSKENIEAIYELSPMQEGMFFHSQFAPESGVYFQQLSCVLEGQLHTDAFHRAWQRVVDRHAILRTAFVSKRLDKPLQIVSKHINLEIETHDWRDVPQDTQPQQLEDFLREDKQRGFDLSRAPLMRLFLIRLTDDRYQFVWSHSNMLLDGWSLFSVLKEVFEFYNAFSKGVAHDLPAPAPFKAYIEWLKKQDQENARKFWAKTLSGFTEPNTIDIKSETNAQGAKPYCELQIDLPESLTSDLQAFGRKQKVTLNTIVQGAWAMLQHLYTGDDDIVFGTTVSGRPPALENVESMVGLFINTLPLRVAISSDDQLVPWLQRIQRSNVELRDYEYSQLVDVQRNSDVPAGTPLFNSIIVFENFPVDSAVNSMDMGLKILSFSFTEQTNYRLTLIAIPGKRMVLKIAFAPREYHPAVIQRMLSHLERILESMIAAPERKLVSFVAPAEQELQTIRAKLIGTTGQYPLDRCVHELFEQQVERTPENVALTFESQSLTYAELNRRANQLAHYLRRLGAQPETKIGICLDRSLEMIVAVWGILKSGAAYVPLDPKYPQDRLDYMSQDAGVALLVTKEAFAAERNSVRVIKVDADRDLIAREPETNPTPVASPENLAYIIYTSGSTGLPKGVMVAHRSLVNYVLSMIPIIGLGSEERFLQFASLSFDASAVQIYPTLLSGATLVLHPSPAELSNHELKAFCEKEQVTVLDIPAGFWQQWVEDLSSRDDAHERVLKRSIRFYMTGGESVSSDRVRLWSKMLEKPASFLSSYGPTETTIGAMISITESDAASDLKRPHLPLGFTLPNVEIHLLDRHLRPVPLGVTGEIYIGGTGLARGYLGRAAQTAEKFVPDGLSAESGRRLYRTGDLARIVDGELEYVGRVDEQVKVRGFRVELGEIEAELNRQPEVNASAVVLQEDRLVAYVELRENIPAAELMKRLRERLPEWMVPGVYERVAKLPLSANGKVDRNRLRSETSERLARGTEYEQPRSGVEEVLSGIWSEVLKVERVGIHDNFFELGGHSLMATQLMSRVRDVLKLDVPMKVLFDSPTVAGLGAVIEPQLRSDSDFEMPPLVPVERNGSGPVLSFAQQRLWILDQLDPGTPAFNLPAAARLKGPLDAAALARTLNEIVARHESLRTTFAMNGGTPVQVITPSLEVDLPLVDLSDTDPEQHEANVQRLANEELARPFDLTRGPLLRALLIRLEPEHHVFLMTMHHIVSDGWSMIVFLRELAQIYASLSLDKPSPLPPLSIQYADFATWQREWLKDAVLEAQLGYWKERLNGDIAVLNLPTDHPRPAIQTFNGGTHTLLLPPALQEALNALSRREGTTLFMTVLAAFKTLLYRYCGESDVTIGTPIANRNRSEVEPLIGFFLNTLVLRTDLSGNPTFRELLGRVRDVALGAYAHQDIPFELLLEQLQPERDLSRTPFFQVMFNMLNFFSSSTIELPNLVVEGFSPFEASAKFDLNVYAAKQENGLRLDFIYNRDLFERETIEQMANHFRNLLQSVASNPRQKLAEIPLLTEANRKEIAARATQSRPTNAFREWPKSEIEQTISARFEEQVEQYADNVAVQTNECSLTYRELNTWSNNVAAAITSDPNNIALVFEPGATTIVAIIAALKAGRTYVPADPQNPIDRLHVILEDSEATAIVTDTKNLSLSEKLSNGRLPIINVDEVDRTVDMGRPSATATPDSHAYILYTSGSTGQPKGVVQNHRNVLFHIRNYTNNLHISANDKLTLLSSYGFDAAVMDIFGALLNGATLCPFDIKAEGLAGFYQWLVDNEITIYHSTPTVYRYFLDSLMGDEQFPGIRLVVLGGEEVYKRDVDLFKQYFAPDCIFVNGLGPTESTVTLQYFITKDTPVERATVPVGYPVEGTEILLLGPAPDRTEVYGIGEIAIRSPHVAVGYWHRPELTRAAFTEDRDRRTYSAGDLGRLLPDGTIAFMGRRDQQLKIRGYRIEPGEVESALQGHPLVKKAAVIARDNGNGEKQLAAYLVPREPAQVSADQIRSFLKDKLPAYMVPAQFAMLESLPLTTTGKIDRQALSKIEPENASAAESSVAPRTPVEEVMASVWSDVLRREKVGIQDNFFELGGHSLLATQVLSRVRDAFNVELPLRAIFENPTIANLSRAVENARVTHGHRIPALAKFERNGESPLSFSQQRLWFIEQLEPGNPAYNIHAAVRLLGDLDTDVLKRSLEAVIERHEILRTTFPEVDDQPVQRIGAPMSLNLPVTDLEDFAADEREAQALSVIIEESQRPFDLAAGPMLRTKLLRMSERDHILILTMHHIVADAWSMGVLVRDAAAFYKAFAEDSAVSLPELEIQYADYASWQRAWLQPERLAESLSYWKRQLADKPLSMRLPTDKPRPSAQTSNGALYQVELSDELSSELEDLSRRESVSVFMTLLSAFKVALSRYTGSEDIVVGTDVANRSRSEVEGLIGMFVNQLVLRTDLSGNPAFTELLGRVREVALEAYAHQDTPFDKIVEAIKPDRELDRNPLFQVMFGFQNTPAQRIELPGLSIGRMGIDNKTSVFDLSLYMTRQGSKLVGAMRYNTDLFEPSTVGRILDAFKLVLQTVVKAADVRLDALLEFIESEERAQAAAKEQELEQARIQAFTKVRRRTTQHRITEPALI